MELKDHVILITGAAGGLGSTAAIALAKIGATIILLDKDIPKLEAVYDQIIAVSAPTPVIHPFDLAGANEQQYQELADAILEKYGSLQGLLHSATELKALGPISTLPLKSWDHSLTINLNAPFLLTQVLLPVLQQSQYASIVFTSDSKVRTAKAYSSAYGVAKIALEGFASILADELESAGKIRVNTLIPGPVASPIRNKQFPAEDKSQLAPMNSLDNTYQYLFSKDSLGFTGQKLEAQHFNLTKLNRTMHESESDNITLTRDVNVVTIPDGDHSTLTQGTVVTIHQSLGNNYTVVTDYGNMVRISGADADALGKETHNLQTLVTETDPDSVEKNCWEVMKTVYDPEIPVNIVDLGLVYHCHVTAAGEGLNEVQVMMTLTAPGCGMGPVIQSDVEKCIRALPGVENITVEVVLDPPWSQDMMSEVAKVQLGLF